MWILFSDNHVLQLATIEPYTLFDSSMHVLEYFFKVVSHCPDLYFRRGRLNISRKKKSPGLKSGDLGGHSMVPFRDVFFSEITAAWTHWQ